MLFELYFSFYLLATGFFGTLVNAQFASTNNFWPASWPLTVRSPYLNTWLDTPNGTVTPLIWPKHWDDGGINGWSGSVRVDGVGFNWLGSTGNQTTIESATLTPTRSNFIVRAGGVSLNITFLNPIEPSDLAKQSFPFSYLSVIVSSADGNAHTVQLYSDISAEWLSGDRTDICNWNTTQTATSVYHQAFLPGAIQMQEKNDQAEDGVVYYGMQKVAGISFKTGADVDCRGQFASTGALDGGADTAFRAINNRFPVYAIAVNLGTVSATAPSSPVTWALGYVRDPVVQYAVNSGIQTRRSLFWTKFASISDAIDAFVTDFPNAMTRSAQLDARILADANTVSADYADLVSMAVRQTMGGMDITVGVNSDSSLDTNDIKAFVKDLGNSRRVNPLEVLYAAFPTLLYLNPDLGRYVLDPILQYQNSPIYKNPFAASDLGNSYPSAMGNNEPDSNQAVDDSGSILLMTWAHATFSGDGVLISNYYDLLKTYANYLVSNTLTPTGQFMDGLSKPNMTNLALKGILGIQAMSLISKTKGSTSDAQNFSSTASTYAKEWASFSLSSGHLLSTYDASAPPGIIYNLFFDKWLKFGLVDDSVYQAQSTFYASEVNGASPFGLPLDGSTNIARSQWTLFAAGAVPDTGVRNSLIEMVRKRATLNVTNSNIGSLGAFPTTYDVTSGKTQSGAASPAQGAILAPVALNLATSSSINVPAPTTTSKTTTGGSNTSASGSKSGGIAPGAIAGIVIGIIVVLALLALLLFLRLRKQRDTQASDFTPQAFPASEMTQPASQYAPSQYAPSQYGQPQYAQSQSQSQYAQSQAAYAPNQTSYPQYQSSASEGPYQSPPLPPPPPASQPGYAETAYDPYSTTGDRTQLAYMQAGSRYSVATTALSGGTSRSGGKASEGGSSSRSDATALRGEVENLRRDLEELKAQRQYELQPPPEYG